MMKVLFLDFDGVLNSERYVRNCGEYGVIIDKSRMQLLRQIIESTGAQIVLSTSWREYWSKGEKLEHTVGAQIDDIFKEHGLEIFDKTPKLGGRREEEIESWLNDFSNVENFVILDDRFLYAEFMKGHFVKTANYLEGLDEENVALAIEILNS